MTAIVLSITGRCNARCSFCLRDSSPEKGEDMPLEDALKWIDEINTMDNMTRLFFSGGEPFLRFDDMLTMIKRCRKPYGIFSNGFWGKDPAKAKEFARRLAATGRKGRVFLSTDRSHQEFVPVESIKNCITALLVADIDTVVQCIGEDGAEFDEEAGEIGDFVVKHRKETRSKKIKIQGRDIGPNGRAKKLHKFDLTPLSSFFVDRLCVGSPNIYHDGAVHVCSCAPTDIHEGSPLYLGNLHDASLNDILRKTDRFYTLMRRVDRFRLMADLLGDRLRPAYSHHCELCQHIFNDPEMRSIVLANLESLLSEGNVAILTLRTGKEIKLGIRRLNFATTLKAKTRRGRIPPLSEMINAGLVGDIRFASDDKADPANKIYPISIISKGLEELMDMVYDIKWRQVYH